MRLQGTIFFVTKRLRIMTCHLLTNNREAVISLLSANRVRRILHFFLSIPADMIFLINFVSRFISDS